MALNMENRLNHKRKNFSISSGRLEHEGEYRIMQQMLSGLYSWFVYRSSFLMLMYKREQRMCLNGLFLSRCGRVCKLLLQLLIQLIKLQSKKFHSSKK